MNLTTNAETFLDSLSNCNLLSDERVAQLRAEATKGADGVSANQLAGRLVDRELLTSWQAEMLLSGRHAFFLGKYKLLDHIGSGGMGSVFKAEQAPLGRIVAVKVMASTLLEDETAIARFHREIRAAAALNHPNIVTALDAESVGDTHFLVMEYVEGLDLGSLIKGGRRLHVGEACEYVRQAALGLQHAHERGMVHRDIKPSNLLLGWRNETEPVVKILDMGLARFESELGVGGNLTATGQIMGTPDYISPEQARDTRHADIRSDIYSLGCTLYRFLSGQVCFGGNTMDKLMLRGTSDAPRVASVRSDIPAQVDSIVAKMLSRDPGQRFQTPSEVAEALAPFAELSVQERTIEVSDLVAAQREQPTLVEPAPAHESRAHAEQPSISVDPGFQLFLNVLATKVAVAEEPDASTQNVGKAADPEATQAVTAKQPTRTRAGRQLQEQIRERNRAEKRRMVLSGMGIVVFAAIVAGYAIWYESGETHLIIDWPHEQLKSVTLKVDGRPRRLLKANCYEYRGRRGTYQLRLSRDDYLPIEVKWNLTRGERKNYRPDWKPTPTTIRKRELTSLKKRVQENRVATESRSIFDPTSMKLRDDLVDFDRRFSGSAEAIETADLLSQLRWPVDQMRRENIRPAELQAAGGGDRGSAPSELVAVLGDSRLKHWGRVNSVAFSPDGKTLASAGYDDGVRLWDVSTGELIRTLPHHRYGATSVAFSYDGRFLVSGGADGAIALWDLKASKQILGLPMHNGGVPTVCFRLDGGLVASGGRDHLIKLWEPLTGEVRWTLEGHTQWVRSVAFNSDGTTLVSGEGSAYGKNGVVKLWDVTNAKEELTLRGHKGEVCSVAFSPDGATVASAGDNIRIWDRSTGQELMLLRSKDTSSIAFSPDGKTLVSGSFESSGVLKIWDLSTAELKRSLKGMAAHLGPVNCLSFNPSGNLLASGGSDGSVKLWDTKSWHQILRAGHSPDSIAVNSHGTLLAAGSAAGTIKLWSLANGEEIHTLDRHIDSVHTLAFSPNGEVLASGSEDKTIKLWDTNTGNELETRTMHFGVRCLAYSPAGALLASGGKRNLKLWELSTGIERAIVDDGDLDVAGVAFSATGARLVAVCNGGVVRIWDTRTAKEVQTIKNPDRQHVWAADLSPDSTKLAFGGSGNRLLFWDMPRGRELWRHELPTPTGGVSSIAFSANGKLLVSARHDGTVRLWQSDIIRTPLKTIRLSPGGKRIRVTFTPDSRHLVTANGNGTIYILRLKEPLIRAKRARS